MSGGNLGDTQRIEEESEGLQGGGESQGTKQFQEPRGLSIRWKTNRPETLRALFRRGDPGLPEWYGLSG